jgi:hypothetical protein
VAACMHASSLDVGNGFWIRKANDDVSRRRVSFGTGWQNNDQGAFNIFQSNQETVVTRTDKTIEEWNHSGGARNISYRFGGPGGLTGMWRPANT